MDQVKKYTSQDFDVKNEVNIDKLYGKDLLDTFDMSQELVNDMQVQDMVQKVLSQNKLADQTANNTIKANVTSNVTANISSNASKNATVLAAKNLSVNAPSRQISPRMFRRTPLLTQPKMRHLSPMSMHPRTVPLTPRNLPPLIRHPTRPRLRRFGSNPLIPWRRRLNRSQSITTSSPRSETSKLLIRSKSR
jgi:hypothetical protein